MLAAAVLVALANVTQPFSYMDELRQAERAFAQNTQPGPQRDFAPIQLAFAQSFVDASEKAGFTYFTLGDSAPPTPEQAAANVERALEIVREHEPRGALTAIVNAARGRQIVIINEAHFTPRHRAFSTEVALALRKLGFEYLAVETLDNRTPEVLAGLERRGYPRIEDGYYSREPIFGDFLRRSLGVGYHLVAYEFAAFDAEYQKLDPAERQIRREDSQAQNIIDHVLARNPRARILVHVGHGHVSKTPVDIGGREVDMMAASLRKKTGIDPLCIEQTRSAFPAKVEMDLPLTASVLPTFDGDSFVMARRDGAGYWHAGDVDIQVWHRPESLRQGRPNWLAMNGYRRPRPIPAKLLPRQGRRLIQAFIAGESPDAVPMDQVLVTAGELVPVFMLPKGRYRFAWQE